VICRHIFNTLVFFYINISLLFIVRKMSVHMDSHAAKPADKQLPPSLSSAVNLSSVNFYAKQHNDTRKVRCILIVFLIIFTASGIGHW
jgi:hypothetical protein